METLKNSNNVQKNMNIINTLDGISNNSSVDLLKVSDTTLESSSCDDGKYIFLFNTFIPKLDMTL